VTIDTARRITQEIRDEVAQLKASDAERQAKELADLDEKVAASRRRAEKLHARDRRLMWGVESSAPGDEKEWSKAGAGFSEEDE
jgi:hypothetical protein